MEKEKRGGRGGRGGLGGETEREKKWRMETHRERRDGSRGGDSSRGTDRQTDWNEFARADFNFFVSVSAAGELESLLLYL